MRRNSEAHTRRSADHARSVAASSQGAAELGCRSRHGGIRRLGGPARRVVALHQVGRGVVVVVDDPPHRQDLVRRLPQQVKRRLAAGRRRPGRLQQLAGDVLVAVQPPADRQQLFAFVVVGAGLRPRFRAGRPWTGCPGGRWRSFLGRRASRSRGRRRRGRPCSGCRWSGHPGRCRVLDVVHRRQVVLRLLGELEDDHVERFERGDAGVRRGTWRRGRGRRCWGPG